MFIAARARDPTRWSRAIWPPTSQVEQSRVSASETILCPMTLGREMVSSRQTIHTVLNICPRKESFVTRGCRSSAGDPSGFVLFSRVEVVLAVLLGVALSVRADSYWLGGVGDFDVAASWNPAGVPTGVNAINDSGSRNVVLVRP